MPEVDRFERWARKVRRLVRRLPVAPPLLDRLGLAVWRRHLRRTAREAEIVLPSRLTCEAAAVARVALDEPVRDGRPARDRRAAGGETAVSFDAHGRLRVETGGRQLREAIERQEREVVLEVAGRHPRWRRTALEIRAYAHLRGGSAYQPYLHPDLVDLPSDQPGEARFRLLRDALPIDRGTVLDLGANSGYFCHRFESAGFDCVAVERSAKEAYFLKALRLAHGARFEIVHGSFTDARLPRRPDLVLALNIFHHFLKTESAYRDLESFLGRLEARYLFFQAHREGEVQMSGATRDMAPGEFVEWVRSRADFGRVTEVGRGEDGRPIFLLERGE